MAKKLAALFLAVLMAFSCLSVLAADAKKTYKTDEITEFGSEVTKKDGYFNIKKAQSWFGIKNVDLTGIKSIGLTGKNPLTGGLNAEVFRIKVDDPMGDSIGFIAFNETSVGSDVTVRGNIDAVSGTHTLYFVMTMTKNTPKWELNGVSLYTDAVVREGVSDEYIVDNYSDTWAATDDYGRKVADFEEAGPVKEGDHYVGMMYWNWHTNQDKNYNIVIPDVIRKDPAARYDFNSDSWFNHQSKMYWGEPVFGFYTSQDYWVYKKQFALLSNAGVDVIFFDYTNGGLCFVQNLKTLMEALLECKKEGMNVPKISEYGGMAAANNNMFDELMTIYYNVLKDERYSDLWFHWEGRPFAASWKVKDTKQSLINTKDSDLVKTEDIIDTSMNLRHHGSRLGASEDHDDIMWLDSYPQPLRGKLREDGRVESVTVGAAINSSTIYGHSKTGVFSDPYAKGRAFSEAFGEDYSSDNGRKPYFWREQARLALDVDPAFIYIDGWNEWTTPKYSSYGEYKVAFVDLFDEEGSRDFEPSRSYLKDDYYNLLVDFIRKYKGVRPAPLATSPVTIDIAGDISQWDSVGPEFINDYTDFERDSTGYLDMATGKPIPYKTTVNNAIMSAKVARDGEKLYFMAKTNRPVKEGGEGFMNLYINSDRNYATGWAGYDYAINKNGKGTVAKYESGAWTTVGTAEIAIKDNYLTLSVPRELLNLPGTLEFEFKWTDSVVTDDYLDFYSEGSVAPSGKFNYLYTETAQVSLSSEERALLSGTSVLKAGSGKMVVSGGRMNVYERDTNVTPFEANGTLYVPAETFEELLGYGMSKVRYDSEDNIIYLARHDLSDDYKEITNYVWTYSVIGSNEVRTNGEAAALFAPVTVRDGIIFVPLTYLSEAFGFAYKALGNGVYAVSEGALNDSGIAAAQAIIG